MIPHQVLLGFLLASLSSALINCSGSDSCFAETSECDPNKNCLTTIHFDQTGNMDIFVRDAVETDYVSIVISRDLHNNVEHIICVPLSRKRFRAMGRFGATVVFTQLVTFIALQIFINFCLFRTLRMW